MRLRQLCLLAVVMIGATAHAEETPNTGNSTPLSLSAGSQISELQQRLKDSERQREELSKQLQNADATRESALLCVCTTNQRRFKGLFGEGKTASRPARISSAHECKDK